MDGTINRAGLSHEEEKWADEGPRVKACPARPASVFSVTPQAKDGFNIFTWLKTK